MHQIQMTASTTTGCTTTQKLAIKVTIVKNNKFDSLQLRLILLLFVYFIRGLAYLIDFE